MNDSTQITTPAEPALPTGTELLTLNPEQYVLAVFAPFRERLDAAKTAAAAVAVVDVRTTAGMKTAIQHRATFRALRVEAEAARQLRKKPILDIGRLLDSKAKELKAEISPLEDRFDVAIKAEERRKEEEKAQRERADRERVERIQSRIKEIRDSIIDAVGRPSAAIAEICATLTAFEVTEGTFFEFAESAAVAKRDTLIKLEEMHAQALAQEAEAARLRAEREEFDRRQREEAEARERRIAEEQRVIGIRGELSRIQAVPVAMIGQSAAAISQVLEAQRMEPVTKAVFGEFIDQARSLRDTAVQQLETMLTDAQARERLKADQDALEEQQRQARLAQEQREREERLAREQQEREERLAQDRREREERERAEAEQRQRDEAARAEREAEETRQREARRQELDLQDIRAALATLRERVTGIDEFAWYARAFDAQARKGAAPRSRKATVQT